MGKYPESIDKITKARLRFSALSSVFGIALTMFFIGLLVFIAFFSTRFISDISKKFEMEILFYSPDANVKEADIIAYEQRLKLQPFVENSRVSSQQENTLEAKKAVGNNYEEVIPNPINASIILTVSPQYTSADSMKHVLQTIMENPQVQDVVYPDYILHMIQNNFKRVQWIMFAFCALFMFVSLMLIANSLRLSIYAKRFNIKSLLLIGATRGFVRRPFLFKGFVQGAWGGFIAVLLLAATLYFSHTYIPEFVDLSQIYVIAYILSGVILFSIIFTVISSYVFVNKYIKINKDRLYL